MFRTVFTPENESDLTVTLPKEYLRKEIEIIAFDIKKEIQNSDFDKLEKRHKILKAIEGLPKVDMLNFKFNREEANER